MPYPFLFGTYSPLRAITNAPANMAMTKEIIPAAAIADAFSASRLYRMMQHLSSSFSNSRKALASQGFPIPKRQALSPDSFSGFPARPSALWGACRQISGRIPRCRQHLLSKGSCPHPASLSVYPDRCSGLRC